MKSVQQKAEEKIPGQAQAMAEAIHRSCGAIYCNHHEDWRYPSACEINCRKHKKCKEYQKYLREKENEQTSH